MKHTLVLLYKLGLIRVSVEFQQVGRAYARINSFRGLFCFFLALCAQIAVPCAAQSSNGLEVGKTDIGLSGQIDRVLWVSEDEILLVRTGSKGVLYASIANIRRHTERKLTGLNKLFTDNWSRSRLTDFHLSSDGHRILWALSYIDGSGTFTCDLNGKELHDWDEPKSGSHSYILGWLSNSHQWVLGVHKIKDPYTHLLIQDIDPHRPKTTIPLDETVQISPYDDISFAASDTLVVFKNIHAENTVHSLELIKLHIGSKVTEQARYTASLPTGDTLIEVALSRNGQKIAVLVERRKLPATPKNPFSGDLKSAGVQYALLVKNIDEPEFHALNISLPTPHYEERVLTPVLWGVSWSPDGDKLGYCLDDSVFVFPLEGSDTTKTAGKKHQQP